MFPPDPKIQKFAHALRLRMRSRCTTTPNRPRPPVRPFLYSPFGVDYPMSDKHPLLIDRITVRMNGAVFTNLPLPALQVAYVEELTTAYAHYASTEDADGAVVNLHAIAAELRRRDRDEAQHFIDEVHTLLLEVHPDLDLTAITCH